MPPYRPTIGLEIHAELKTNTKMFCRCMNNARAPEPNVYVCPICMGHPGTLPTINKAAVRSVLRVGAAVGGVLADFTEFDRKNYFYPDIPKGYQISQYAHPLVSGGTIGPIALTRIHLEEDTASSMHEASGASTIDFNRAGVPLMELVTEPVIHSAEEAVSFARELQTLLRFLDVSDADMEHGEMRVEANISVAREGSSLGTKVEVKNLNSFRSVERAIAFEIARHTALLEQGESVVQETRGWDETRQVTFSQRKKEYAQDYRYFPDPDLPKLYCSEVPELRHDAIIASLPELPWDMRTRLIERMGLPPAIAEVFIVSRVLGAFFDAVVALLPSNDKATILRTAHYLSSDLVGIAKDEYTLAETITVRSPQEFAVLMAMAGDGRLSSRGTKDVLKIWFDEGGSPDHIATTQGLLQSSDNDLIVSIAAQVVAEHALVVAEYRAGKTAGLQFLIGQGMKASKGKANPEMLKQTLEKMLNA